MIQSIINWFIRWYYPNHILIPKDELIVIDKEKDEINAMIKTVLYDKVLALARNIEPSKSLGENKRIYVKTAVQAERRRLDLSYWPERDINLAIELAIRKL
mgnify:CR=1 FL=1